jgi:hypothetical protein
MDQLAVVAGGTKTIDSPAVKTFVNVSKPASKPRSAFPGK